MTSARSYGLMAILASPLFVCAAIAGWLYGVWPATPLTLAIAACAVVGGPLLGIFHMAAVADARAGEEPRAAFTRAPAPVINLAEARARAFHNWREAENPVLARRERERRASRYLRA